MHISLYCGTNLPVLLAHISLYSLCTLICSPITPGEGARTGTDRARDSQTETELQVITSVKENTCSDLYFQPTPQPLPAARAGAGLGGQGREGKSNTRQVRKV